MPDAFYEAAVGDGKFVATALTRGPWDPGAQHAGPPAALLARAIEQLPDSERFQVARVTFEILRSVPIGPVLVSGRVVRPGRRVRLVEAELSVAGEPLMRATAWQIEVAPVELPAGTGARPPAPSPPEEGAEADFFPGTEDEGYHTAMEVSFAAGQFIEIGPATAWLRMRVPLVAGEEPTPLQRAMIAADVGNGISRGARLPRVHLRQRRADRPPRADAGRRVDLRRRGDAAAADRRRHRRVGPLRRRGPDRPRRAEPDRQPPLIPAAGSAPRCRTSSTIVAEPSAAAAAKTKAPS